MNNSLYEMALHLLAVSFLYFLLLPFSMQV